MVGSAILRVLEQDRGKWQIITRDRKDLDLCNQAEVEQFFEEEKPQWVINAAARVGEFMPIPLIQPNLFIKIF